MTKELFLRSFFTRLNKDGIRYFVFGSYQSLPQSTGGSDIDIIIDESDLAATGAIIKDIIKRNDIILASFFTNSTSHFYRLLTTSWGVQIDLFYKGFCYRGVPYFPLSRLQNDLMIHNEIVHVLDEKRGFYLDFFKEIIHNGKAKDKYTKAFIDLINNDKSYYLQEIEEVFGSTVRLSINNHCTTEGLCSISKLLQKQLQNAVLSGHFSTILGDRFDVLSRFFKPRPGYVIVVEGTDGSGKSTIINHITPLLNECFHKFVVYTHLRPKAIPDLGVVLGKKSADEAEHVNSDPHKLKQSGLLGSLLRWGYYMIDYAFGYLYKVWIHIHTKSKVFIFDRYYYDYYIDQKRSRTNLPKWVIRLGEFFIAKPDIILCLGGNPEAIYARKPETSLQEVKRQTEVLKAFCDRRSNAVWVDTTQPIEKSCEDAMTAIVKLMSTRFSV